MLSLGEEVDVENEQLTLISDYKVIHSSILQQMLQSVSKCKHCSRENTAYVFQENSKKKGLCEKFVIKCKRCTRLLGNYNTSPNVVARKMFDVNLRSVNGYHVCWWWIDNAKEYLYKYGHTSTHI